MLLHNQLAYLQSWEVLQTAPVSALSNVYAVPGMLSAHQIWHLFAGSSLVAAHIFGSPVGTSSE